MALRSYSVTLDEKVVERALKISQKYGGKFSPLLNQIILEWVIKEEKENNI